MRVKAKQIVRRARDARSPKPAFEGRTAPAPCEIFGQGLEEGALQQMRNACQLPVAVAGALMPDAHQGYGLPIGGVLATDNAVIPYAVGVDIACRMKMTVLDLPVADLETKPARPDRGARGRDPLRRRRDVPRPAPARGDGRGLERVARHGRPQGPGLGAARHERQRQPLRRVRRAHGARRRRSASQPGEYLALLSHSGSRGTGNAVATHYSRVARDQHPRAAERAGAPGLARPGQPTTGQEYWAAMELMGRYAAANHELIHAHIARALGVDGPARHREPPQLRLARAPPAARRPRARRHRAPQGRDAGRRGRARDHPRIDGDAGLRRSRPRDPRLAAVGVPRCRTEDEPHEGQGRQFSWADAQRVLRERRVTLLSAGLDEVPMAYKDIDEVMAAQRDLVEHAGPLRPAPGEDGPGRRSAPRTEFRLAASGWRLAASSRDQRAADGGGMHREPATVGQRRIVSSQTRSQALGASRVERDHARESDRATPAASGRQRPESAACRAADRSPGSEAPATGRRAVIAGLKPRAIRATSAPGGAW